MNEKKTIISTSSFAKYDKKPLEMLKETGLSVELNPYGRKLTESEIKDFVKDADLLIAGTESLSRNVLKSAKKLKIISRCGTGIDNIDLKTAEELGIKVFNTPFGPTQAVAELTVGLILDLLRKVSQMDRNLRKGLWKKQMGNLLQYKRVGIIGFGRIGQKVAELLLPFGVEISYYDTRSISSTLNCKPSDFESLLSWADIISIHLSASSSSKPIIRKKELKLMKPESWLINTARGEAVDEDSLYIALKEKHLTGAALDVFGREPYSGPLTELENVILTPHIGSYAKEARLDMEIQAVKNLLRGLNNTD